MAERRLDTPRDVRRGWRPAVDSDAVGRGAETFARFMGTGKFLLYMTAFVIVWVLVNGIGLYGLHWDPYPFILLNLFFSVQASYAAPLILLAQNRQDDRDRVALEQDRQQAERNLADTEFLAREMASLRIALAEVATRDFVRSELRNLLEELTTDDDEDESEAERAERAERKRNRKREARAEAERKREARAEAERKRQARVEAERKREARAEAERKREARAEGEARRDARADAEAERKREAQAEAEAKAKAAAKRAAEPDHTRP